MKIPEIFKKILEFFRQLEEEFDKAGKENQKFCLDFYEKHGYYPDFMDPFNNSDIWP